MFSAFLLNSCNIQNQQTVPKTHTNALIHETSPYLLQHAHNPVNWMPWGQEAFDLAKKENKLVIISIGYSSCHWCHVMEHQTFEDSGAAALMNQHFIPIKVDREERPDVDQIYMTAVQLMTRQGGWPLNVVALPDGRPIWGGTYFPRENWMQALQSIFEMYRDDPEKVREYAERLHEGIRQSELVDVHSETHDFNKAEVESLFQNWKNSFDTIEGGPKRAPKFPMPSNYEFLLQYGQLTGNKAALAQVQLTLKKMAHGGMYDQVGGGFARYSTDDKWKVPHFEKMLYDNAQLVSLYSHAWQKFKDPLYKEIVKETLSWTEREMSGPDAEYYSALDADSEGEEGKFYVWNKDELQLVIPKEDWQDFQKYYDLKKGAWEGKIILLRSAFEPSASEQMQWDQKVQNWKKLLLQKRSGRIRPGLDDKSLSSWNALMISALVDAHKAFARSNEEPDDTYLNRALRSAQWLLNKQAQADGSLHHSYKKGKSTIDGLIEDYAFSIQAFLKLFEVSGSEKYLQQADQWMQYAKSHFEDTATGLFYMRNLAADQLIAKSLETVDNVIPSSNSVMAQNLFLLSHYLDKETYRKQAEKMLNQLDKERLLQYGDNYSNWAQLLLHFTFPYYEVAICGRDAQQKYLALQQYYLPNAIWIKADTPSELPLLKDRFMKGATRIYVCQNKVCRLPVETVEEAVKKIRP